MTTPSMRSVLLFLALAGAAALSTLLLMTITDEAPGTEAPGLSLSFYLQGAEVLGTDETGAVVYRLSTDRAEQNPADSSIRMQRLDMQYGPAEGPVWSLQSDTGRMTPDATRIEFRGNVKAELTGTRAATTLVQTQQLDFDPATRIASTRARVAITFDTRVLNASGLEANLETNTLQLLSNVHGKFNP